MTKIFTAFKILEIIYIMATRTISPEANNYVRLDLAIKGPCTECLRDVLQKSVPVGSQGINHALQSLESHLKQNLESYKYSKLFTNSKLRATFSVLDCDMSLVYSLIRNSNWVPPPTRGWGKKFLNSPQDISLGANVERLHLFRNKLDHCKEPSVSNQDFNNYWTEVKKYVADIETSLGSTHHQESLDRLRGQDLDPEYANRIIHAFSEVVRNLQAEQHRQLDSIFEIRKDQSGHGSTLSDIKNSLNEQNKDMFDLKTEESKQSKLLCEIAVINEQQYQLLENDRCVLSDIKKSQAHLDLSICEVLDALRDEDNGLVRITKEQNNQMQHLNKKLEEVHANQMFLLNNNKESFKMIQEIVERRSNEDASYTDPTDIPKQNQNEADDKTATTDALDCNVNSENEISIAEGPDGVICLIKQYGFLKSNLSKTKAKAIADCLLKEKRITYDEHETIADLNLPRRLRIDLLLKKIILGDSDQLKTFFKVLKSVDLTVARILATTDVSDQEKSRFRQLEEREYQETNATGRTESKCTLDNSDIRFFQYHLSAFDEDIDSINDAMLSRFNFSVRDHSNVLHAKTLDEKIEKLCQTMNFSAINIENELNTLLKPSLYQKWITLRKKNGNHDRQLFLQWFNAPVNLVSYVFGCSRLRFNQAETGSIILKFSIEDGFNVASLTRSSLQENITDLLWKGFMETQISMIKPVHVTVFVMSPRENGQDEIHLYIDFDTTDDTTSREDSEHDISIQERKLLLEELDSTELTEWITCQLDVEKNAIHMLEDKLSLRDIHGKKEMVVFLDSIHELENGRDMVKEFCNQNKQYEYREQYLITDSTVKHESLLENPESGPVHEQQQDPVLMDRNASQRESHKSTGYSSDSETESDMSYWSSDSLSPYPLLISIKQKGCDTLSPSSGISSGYSDSGQSYSVHKTRKTADSKQETRIHERKLPLEELDPTELIEWITNHLDEQKTKIHMFEDKLSKSDMNGKDEMVVLIDSIYTLEKGQDLIKRFCKEYDPYVYRKLFLTNDQHSTEKLESPIEKPLQYERGGGLQRLYSFWIDISTDQNGMNKSQETDELVEINEGKKYPADEKAQQITQNLEAPRSVNSSGYSDSPLSCPAHETLKMESNLLNVAESDISAWYSHSSKFNLGYKMKKEENEFMKPLVEKSRGIAFVLQVGKLDEIWSDVMVIVGKDRSSLDLPRKIIEKVGPQIQREFQDKYPNGLGKNEVAVLSGFNLPVWKIIYCKYSVGAIENCVEMADKLRMRSILFLVQEEGFTVRMADKVKGICRYVLGDRETFSVSGIYFHVDQDTLEWKELRKIAEYELFARNDVKKMSGNPEPKVYNVGHTTVIIQFGKLEEIQSDAVVIFEVAKKQWPTQNLPSEIFEKAGPIIQREFKQKYPAGLKYAEVAVLNGYNLPCRKLLYGVLPCWPFAWLKQVIEVYLAQCFELASEDGMQSISFVIPSVTYHVAEMYASVLHSCVELRIFDKPSLSNTTQKIVIKDGCTEASMLKKVFEEEWGHRRVFKEGHVTVVIREGLLEDVLLRRLKKNQTCAILSEEMQEKAIIPDSKALVIISDSEDITNILEEISPSLKAELRTEYASGLPNKKMSILDGYNNPFKKIYCTKDGSNFAMIDIILESFQMAENDTINSITLLIRPDWVLKREFILGLRIFVIENPSSSIKMLYSDSEILRQEISGFTSMKVFKERHVTVVLNATYNEGEYMWSLRPAHDGGPAEKTNSVDVICGVADERQAKGDLQEYLELVLKNDLYIRKGFSSREVFVFEHKVWNTLRVFFGTPKLDRQELEIFFAKCLQKADASRVSSVTFLVPNIVLNIKLFASTLSSCLKRFAANTPSTSIKRIYIRIDSRNPELQEIEQVFEEEWEKASGEEEPEDFLQIINEPQEKRGGKQGYPSEDIHFQKAMTYIMVAEKPKEASKYIPEEEVD